MPGTDFSEQISGRIVCGGRPRQTLHAILVHGCTNNTDHVPYCFKVCLLLQEEPLCAIGKK